MILSINPDNPQKRLITRVCEVLERGGLIAYPTDTFYGIGCDLVNKRGIQLIHKLKDRPLKQPFSIFCDSLKEISLYAQVSNNDFDDVRHGVDSPDVPTARYRPHPLMEGHLRLEQVRMAAYLLYLLAAAIGLFLAATRGILVLFLGLIGTAAGITYTAAPLNYKYKALGEFSVFLMWGRLMVTGAYYVQQQNVSADSLLISIPFGVLVALVLLANNMRDVTYDRSKGIQTLAIMLGERKGISVYLGLIVAAYLPVVVMSVVGPLTLW